MEPEVFASLVKLNPAASQTLVVQLYRAVREHVLAGRLQADDRLPGSRVAAASLGIGRNTVNAAYDLLLADGIIEIAARGAPRVACLPLAGVPAARTAARLSVRAHEAVIPVRQGLAEGTLAPGSPDPALFPADHWGRSLRRAARYRQDGAQGYGHYSGLPQLRAAVADQLRQHRGLAADPDDIIITPGTQASLVLAAMVLADPGERALVESPGYPGAIAGLRAAGLDCQPLPVDGRGADPACADWSGVRLVYVTPSTQYPTGVRMATDRRAALVEQASSAGAVIIEDDYDYEFLWAGQGLAALAAMPGIGANLYLGSAAKSLLPALRLGWMVATPDLAEPLRAMQARLGLAANVHVQAAFAETLASGSYRSHLGRVARTYKERLGLLLAAIESEFGSRITLSRPAGGLQLVIRCGDDRDDQRLRARLNAAGFAVAALSDHCLGTPEKGLVVGFGSATPASAHAFARMLAALV
ncbi:MAG: PLP-dependent aminotransferase family protein [Porphyrobacter sp.]|nr:PLP-dependent aminotransferase family protein [Porphyrobacter sp.]